MVLKIRIKNFFSLIKYQSHNKRMLNIHIVFLDMNLDIGNYTKMDLDNMYLHFDMVGKHNNLENKNPPPPLSIVQRNIL
jgi:hypothetical protein